MYIAPLLVPRLWTCRFFHCPCDITAIYCLSTSSLHVLYSRSTSDLQIYSSDLQRIYYGSTSARQCSTPVRHFSSFMTIDGKKDDFSEDLIELQKQYTPSVMSIVTEHFDEIEKALAKKVPLVRITETLNTRFGLTIKPTTVSQCLCRIRKQQKTHSRPSTTTRSKRRQSTTASSAPKANAPSNRSKDNTQIFNPSRQEPEDDWNDTEHLIGYRLEDCIRPYVSVVDGEIKKDFPKGTILRLEIRNALARLDNIVHPS